MKELSATIPTYLGDLIIVKWHLDQVKNKYEQINLSYHTGLWNKYLQTSDSSWRENEKNWRLYLGDMGNLFFSEPPYRVSAGRFPDYPDLNVLLKKFSIPPTKPELGYLLCKGKSLELNEQYIVVSTKIRHIRRNSFYPLSIELWSVLRSLSEKYRIVILGEREVERRKEYEWEGIKDGIFGIYEQIISNVPADRITDLTIPKLGNTPSNLKQVQQDCLIMKEAKAVITIGIGGNFCMSTAVANMAIGWRQDDMWLTDVMFNDKHYTNAFITKNWDQFINRLKGV